MAKSKAKTRDISSNKVFLANLRSLLFSNAWGHPRFLFYFFVVTVLFSLLTAILPETKVLPKFQDGDIARFAIPFFSTALTLIVASAVDILNNVNSEKNDSGMDIFWMFILIIFPVVIGLSLATLQWMVIFIVSILLYLFSLFGWVMANSRKDEFQDGTIQAIKDQNTGQFTV